MNIRKMLTGRNNKRGDTYSIGSKSPSESNSLYVCSIDSKHPSASDSMLVSSNSAKVMTTSAKENSESAPTMTEMYRKTIPGPDSLVATSFGEPALYSTSQTDIVESLATTDALASSIVPFGESGNKFENEEVEEIVQKAWVKNQEPKKLPIPTDYPDYMREKPKFFYSETETSLLRRQYTMSRIKSYEPQPMKKNKKLLQQGGPIPKDNQTSSLRRSFIQRKPIISQHFERHYSKYNRPPFRANNVRLNDW